MAAAYISGYNNIADVAHFGYNTQSAMFYQSQHAQHDVHNGITCDSCGSTPLRGIRWRCATCPDHDICNPCKNRGAGNGHTFQIMSVTATNNQIAASEGRPQVAEERVHWTACKGCGVYPIRGTLHSCMVCAGFDMCEACNERRVASGTHQHRFDFFYCPRPCNPPPHQISHYAAQQYITYGQPRYATPAGAAQLGVQNWQQYTEAEQKEILHQKHVEQQQQQQSYWR